MPARQESDPAAIERGDRRAKWLEVAQSLLPISKIKWMDDSVHDVPMQRPELVAATIQEHIDGGGFG